MTQYHPNTAKSWPAEIGKWILRGVLVCTLIVVTCLAALYSILDTQRGSDWLLVKSLSFISPEASFTSYSGTLASGIQLQDLHLPLPSADIRIADIDSSWNLWGILSGELPIHKLHITQLDIKILNTEKAEAETTSPPPWPNLTLPFPVALKDVRAQAINIQQGDTQQYIDEVSLQAHSGLISSNISKLHIESKEYSANLSGAVNNRPPYKMRLNLDWRLRLAEQGQYSGKGSLSGNLENLRLSHQLSEPAIIRSELMLSEWYEPSQALIDIKKMQLEANLNWVTLALPPHQDNGQSAEPLVSSTNGQLFIKGGWEGYSLTFQSQLEAKTSIDAQAANSSQATLIDELLVKPANITLDISGKKLALLVNTLSLKTSAGALAVQGNVDVNQTKTSPSIKWQLKLIADDIDTQNLLPQWPFKLAADIDSSGSWQDEFYQTALTINSLDGELAGKAIAGNGSFDISNTGQTFKKLALQLGDNRLKANGKLADKSELYWELSATDLSQILPDLSGAISSTGSLHGGAITQLFDKGKSPKISATLNAKALRYQQYSVANATLNLNTQSNAAIDLRLHGEGISASVLNNAALDLNGSGTLPQHQFDLQLRDGDKHIDLDLRGALQQIKSQYQWQTNIQRLSLNSRASGPWQLIGNSDLALAANAVSLSRLCLGQDSTRVCSELVLKDGAIKASGLIDALPLERFAAGLPSGSAITGQINSQFSVAGKSDDLSGNITINSEDILIRYQSSADQSAAEYRASFTTKAELEHNRLRGNALFSIDDIGSIAANIATQELSASSDIQGSIEGGFNNLRWLGGLFPQLEKLDGVLTSNISASGQLATPVADGVISLSKVKMDLPELGLSLRDADAKLTFDSRGPWQLDSTIPSGDGSLNISGQGKLGELGGPTGQIQISGENITALDRSEGMLVISPNISTSITPELIKIRGSLDIPKGNYTLKALPDQAAGVSVDERIVNSQSDKSKTQARAIDSRIDITLNDSFEFKGYGLSTRLDGKLKVSQKPEGLLQAFGSLSLYDGIYQAYGQKLNVERGLLIFQGPLDNPGLNITAVRETKTVTVGVNIGGFAQDIRSELFSEPALPPTDVMAILITGKAPSDLNKSDANQVMNAATALGISQSRGITNTLQNTFGVDVISLQGGDSYEDSALVVGKYLTPDLFISYVQNLFTPTGSVQLDYSLSKNLGLKAQSGKAQSIDLLYKIEHGEH
ncbi:translocation/assembly module TamB domain-containing protein [Zhongshania aliphaticivorans]|uniref:translocation/assembly module TamB domain-containing protein n=1 Tax=Zhongshania aliphaticivorans TaxID=1470434 RepID=UPI0012E62A77|nr:translocation/assembly module TamB domain-containing protein [Zhongshania aliphaticivorans]CAA0080113.1 Translocation and assembly module subunit TamB [Zhongshania aliphaticivorans]